VFEGNGRRLWLIGSDLHFWFHCTIKNGPSTYVQETCTSFISNHWFSFTTATNAFSLSQTTTFLWPGLWFRFKPASLPVFCCWISSSSRFMFCVVACFLVRMFWWRSDAVTMVVMQWWWRLYNCGGGGDAWWWWSMVGVMMCSGGWYFKWGSGCLLGWFSLEVTSVTWVHGRRH